LPETITAIADARPALLFCGETRILPAIRNPYLKGKNMSNQIIHTSDAAFEKDVLKAELPVLLDFWAPWCGPCKMIAPILDDIAEEFQGKLQVVKMNIDENEQTPAQFGVRGIPTLMVFNGGQRVATKVGALSKGQLTDFLNASL